MIYFNSNCINRDDAAQRISILDINVFVCFLFNFFNLKRSIEDVSSFTVASRYNSVKGRDKIKSNRVNVCVLRSTT